MVKQRKFDRKFSLLIVIIICALVMGLFLTYISNGDRIISDSNKLRLRGVGETSPSITRFDSDFEHTEMTSNIQILDNFPNNTLAPSSPNPESIIPAEIEIIQAAITTPAENTEKNAMNVKSSSFNSDPPLFQDNNSQPLLLDEAPTIANFSSTSIPLVAPIIPMLESLTSTPSSIPTIQPTIILEELQSFLIPLTNDPSHYLLQDIFHSFWLKKSETLSRMNSKHHSESSQSIAHFHSALKYGEICSDVVTKNSKVKSSKRIVSASRILVDPFGLSSIHQSILVTILSRDIRLFLEYSRLDIKYQNSLSFLVSSHHPGSLSVLFDTTIRNVKVPVESHHKVCGAGRYPNSLNPPANVLIVSPPNLAAGFQENLWSEQFECLQLVNSFQDILSSVPLLPHEYEDALGSLLCRCNITILPSRLPQLAYFSYWESVDLLIEESMRSVQHICSIEVNRTGVKKYSRNEFEFYWIFRNEVESVTQFSAKILLSSQDILPISRSHVLTNLLSPFHNRSSHFHPKSEIQTEAAVKIIEDSLLALDLLIHHNDRKVKIKNSPDSTTTSTSTSSNNKTKSETTWTRNSTSWIPYSFTHSRFTTSENSTLRRKLTDSFSTSSSSSTSSSMLSSSLSHNLELSKKRSQNIQPAKSTFWTTKTANYNADEFDEWLDKDQREQEKLQKENENDGDDIQSPKSDTRVDPLSSTSRRQQYILRAREDRYLYQRWLRVIKSLHFQHSENELIYLFGSHITMLSVKLAQRLFSSSTISSSHPSTSDSPLPPPTPMGLVVSLHTDSQSWEPHRELLETLEISNNLIAYKQLTVPMISSLSLAPELAKLIILQYDVSISLLSLAIEFIEKSQDSNDLCLDSLKLFEELLGVFFLMGEDILFEIPELTYFYTLGKIAFQETENDNCGRLLRERYANIGMLFERVVASMRLPVDMSKKICETNESVDCLHLQVNELDHYGSHNSQRSQFKSGVTQLLGETFKIYHLRLIESSFITASQQESKVQEFGLSVYTLTHFNIDPVIKSTIFKMYLEFPLFAMNKFEKQNLSPWNTFVQLIFNKQTQSTHMDLAFLHKTPTSIGQQYRHNEQSFQQRDDSQIRLSTERLNYQSQRIMSNFYWQALKSEFVKHRAELGPDYKFSFVEHNSDIGLISSQVAKEYRNATVVSLERNEKYVNQHVNMITDLNILNNIVCLKGDSDSYIGQRIYESPELFRFQFMARGFLDSFVDSVDLDLWGKDLGNLLSSALTTFIAVPSAVQVSLAMYLFMETAQDEIVTGSYRSPNDIFLFDQMIDNADPGFLGDLNFVAHHPRIKYRGFETRWLLSYLRVEAGSTEITLTSIYPDGNSVIPILIRCDILNMTRHVHHHYDYAKDGHSRTYTMHIEYNATETARVIDTISSTSDVSTLEPVRVNETIALIQSSQSSPTSSSLQYVLPLGMHPNQHQIVSVRLYRDKDSFFIPYTSIYGITLISLLRLGLNSKQREHLFSSFLRLPLYEDMAPWNIVLMGKEMEYIDYDTREITFDFDVPKSYQVISVLMNYKRTVEDFRRCAGKAPTVYGLAFISDCVASTNAPVCSNLKYPVPCGDGVCHTDYISCLRSLTLKAESLVVEKKDDDDGDPLSKAIVSAMKSGIGKFDNRGLG